ncbi:MAG: 23S rRNA (pseudouridine(1915)-N(3))-methyltransferase RlmH [Devosiaceae bacterium]|nr:23S rRNA (pseudouridine(1915)-N(3))-methyltransferase RlmH [Devosiaceae bacterium MH13]
MITLGAVGRLKAGPERTLFDRYWERAAPLSRHLGFGPLALAEIKEASAGAASARKQAEAEALFSKLNSPGLVLAFDERGESPSSEAFSRLFAQARDDGRAIALLIGGPDGFAPQVHERADRVISFGSLTIPHQLVRVLVAEQVYRALTLIDGHPYHRG